MDISTWQYFFRSVARKVSFHFGFQVDDLESIAATAKELGGTVADARNPDDGRFVESLLPHVKSSGNGNSLPHGRTSA